MREIKFRAWDRLNVPNKIIPWNELIFRHDLSLDLQDQNEGDKTPFVYMQYTGLKDKSKTLTDIYEQDIIGVDGIIRGNKYENPCLLQDRTNLVIEGFGAKSWWTTYKEAVARGCKDSE